MQISSQESMHQKQRSDRAEELSGKVRDPIHDFCEGKIKDTILCGDSRAVLTALPSGIAHTIVTSPPYYGQRDYDHSHQIGIEDAPQDYIDNVVEVFSAARKVLRNDGTLWLNLGDKYVGGRLCGMPWRCALALIDDGWILRSDIIWHKPNAMPSSVKKQTHCRS